MYHQLVVSSGRILHPHILHAMRCPPRFDLLKHPFHGVPVRSLTRHPTHCVCVRADFLRDSRLQRAHRLLCLVLHHRYPYHHVLPIGCPFHPQHRFDLLKSLCECRQVLSERTHPRLIELFLPARTPHYSRLCFPDLTHHGHFASPSLFPCLSNCPISLSPHFLRR